MLTLDHYQMRSEAYVNNVQIWRIFFGLIIVALFHVVGSVGAIVVVELVFGGLIDVTEGEATPQSGLNTPSFIVLYLFSFLSVHAAIWCAARFLHGISYWRFVSLEGRFRIRHFLIGAAIVWFAVGLLFAGAVAAVPLQSNQNLDVWLFWLVPALIALFIQCAGEELVFRGYLQSTLAARFSSPWVWMVVPSILFGMMHFNPGEYGPNALIMVLPPTVLGLIVADITARTGGISAAVGLHFANNAFGILILTAPGPLTALALYSNDLDPLDPATMRTVVIANIAMQSCAYALFRLWLWRQRGLHSDGTTSI